MSAWRYDGMSSRRYRTVGKTGGNLERVEVAKMLLPVWMHTGSVSKLTERVQ